MQPCAAEALDISVRDVGKLRFPLKPAQLRALTKVARPAPFGHRDQTLHDREVRDGLQIAKSRVSIDNRRWNAALQPLLAQIAERLGLPSEGRLEAELNKLLLYGEGQFFVSHQDSEVADEMVGTLVVVLPSEHKGGALIVEHGEQRKSFRCGRASSKLALIAFYADCPHEVRPVREGVRVALTYQLSYRGERPADLETSAASGGDTGALRSALRSYFDAPIPPPSYLMYSIRKRETPSRKPSRLVYLLDHEYSAKSLGWQRLKGKDRPRVAALLAAADEEDLVCCLALADVHEVWGYDGDDSYDGSWRRGRSRYDDFDDDDFDDDDFDDNDFDDGDDDPSSDDDVTLVDLQDSDVELRHWIMRDGERAGDAGAAAVARHELCFSTPSVELKPFRSEREGWMGNYGNTVERWYHRAALVVWPRGRDFLVRAEADPDWGVRQVEQHLAKAATRERASGEIDALLEFWETRPLGPLRDALDSQRFVERVLAIAREIDDHEVASELLAPIGFERLGGRRTELLAELMARYGAAWAQELYQRWARWSSRLEWRPLLPDLCAALAGKPGRVGEQIARWLLTAEVRVTCEHWQQTFAQAEPWGEAKPPTRLVKDTVELLRAAATIGHGEARHAVIATLTDLEHSRPLMIDALLRACHRAASEEELPSWQLRPLYLAAQAALHEELARPARAPDDWSIERELRCGCELCERLDRFLREPTQQALDWPLAKVRRQHVHAKLDSLGLPVSHRTRRRGSPYTLELRKLPRLFGEDAAYRAALAERLTWLESHAATLAVRPWSRRKR